MSLYVSEFPENRLWCMACTDKKIKYTRINSVLE
jgi:hypothetical protein